MSKKKKNFGKNGKSLSNKEEPLTINFYNKLLKFEEKILNHGCSFEIIHEIIPLYAVFFLLNLLIYYLKLKEMC